MKIIADNIIVVGGGLAGTLMAILLAKQGVKNVRVLERQSEKLGEGAGNGRSFNLTLSKRGETALEKAGILDEVLAKTLPITGRMCHIVGELDKAFPYGDPSTHVLHAIRRSDMNSTLLEAAKRYSNIHVDYDVEVLDVNKETGEIKAQNRFTQEPLDIPKSDFIIGADGAFSIVRKCLLSGERLDYSQSFLPWGYREVNIPKGANDRPLLDVNSLHVWPRGDVMMFALPNPDGSFTGNFIYPLERNNDFDQEGYITDLFRREFPDVAPLVPDIEEKLRALSSSNFQTIRTQKWYHGNSVVMLGDAVHGIIPFYGQGMNSAFDDCLSLLNSLEKHGADYESAFEEFKADRKINTDIIADLSISNFEELRSGFRTPLAQARRRVDNMLFSLFPSVWKPLHIHISHSNMSYHDALTRCERRTKIARVFGLDVLVLSALLLNKGKESLGKVAELVKPYLARLGKPKVSGI